MICINAGATRGTRWLDRMSIRIVQTYGGGVSDNEARSGTDSCCNGPPPAPGFQANYPGGLSCLFLTPVKPQIELEFPP
jgi:hypothetical protein